MISKDTTDVLPINSSTISIHREIRRSDASSIFEIELNGKCYVMKVVSVLRFHPEQDTLNLMPRTSWKSPVGAAQSLC
jgi:hypothetical protein